MNNNNNRFFEYPSLFPWLDEERELALQDQLSQDDATERYNNDNIIKNISYNQYEILNNIIKLYTDGKAFDCDLTYSIGNFYGKHGDYYIPQPNKKYDVCPQTDDTIKLEPLTKLPIEDESVDSVVVDLPFVVSCGPSIENGKKTSNIISKRFAAFYPVSELYRTYYFFIKECYRILKPNGTCVFKCQDTVSGGIEHNVEAFSVMCADKVGFATEDKFILLTKNRIISGKVKKQQHARKYTSVFYIFKKWKSKKYNRFNYETILNNLHNDYMCEDIYKK